MPKKLDNGLWKNENSKKKPFEFFKKKITDSDEKIIFESIEEKKWQTISSSF